MVDYDIPTSSQLNPAQKNVLSQLGAKPSERPEFSDDLKKTLKEKLEEVSQNLLRQLPHNESLFVNKHLLTQIMGCEKRYIAESQESFEWSIPTARGTLSHKAIELSIFWQGPKDPLTLTNEALDRAEQGTDYMADWIQGLSEGDRAQLCGEVNSRVGSFLETWPPLEKRWKPMLETPIRVELAEGKVVLSGKVDLTLGSAGGNTAGKVIVDFKTGKFSPSHRDDLRFYALLDTIRIGVPPRLVASYYLDQGEFSPEIISEGVLESTVGRVSDGITRLTELRFQMRPPSTQPGPPCRWCPVSEDCTTGQDYLSDFSE
ncbi:MAG: PD-(D/E)XK nuclease family protein [Acidimicrobiales bacterium]|jgi:CRISPR/Cas system-associated exonuclease Cas4 (RecB family)|nr:PD-(D/E)XK nuclease family protein [Acidimicrobiales bacterium]MDP6299500.1 PD-(D/E)XK nuclease family protein [Acidimicrobiales bacterium]HJM28043.1 PD-(D/E)XK nuclease family protein [Acidimicrobiales bacterium]HJM96610.1 PD-(D/E)XK nuclease family protein [Acidimicrobiales bacterium]